MSLVKSILYTLGSKQGFLVYSCVVLSVGELECYFLASTFHHFVSAIWCLETWVFVASFLGSSIDKLGCYFPFSVFHYCFSTVLDIVTWVFAVSLLGLVNFPWVCLLVVCFPKLYASLAW